MENLDSELLEIDDAITDIPNADAYIELYDKIGAFGYKLYEKRSREDFGLYPWIVCCGISVCGGTLKYKAKRKITYNDFLIKIGSHMDTCNWRDKLSEEFNKKIKSYDEQRVDSFG